MMKNKILFILLSCALAIVGCKQDLPTVGQGILDDDDYIIVCVDTFDLKTALRESPEVISSPDSFLVGEIETHFGALKASLLSQLSCPVGFRYPEGSQVDSIVLNLFYTHWTGDGHSPMSINVYEIDGEVMDYAPEHPYTTDFDLSRYVTGFKSLLSDERVLLAATPQDSTYSNSIGGYIYNVRCTLDASSDFYKKLVSIKEFGTQEAFNQLIKGIYVTSDFGASTILNIANVSLDICYHFNQLPYGQTDSVLTRDIKSLYANTEVRQINRFEYLNGTEKLSEALQNKDTCYIVSPAGIYTSLKLPMGLMQDSIIKHITERRRPYVNLARLRVDVIPSRGIETWIKPADHILLVKDNNAGRIEQFFEKKELPSDTIAVLSTISSEKDELGVEHQYYSFDLSGLLTNQLRETIDYDTLVMTMVPVTVETSSTNTGTIVTSVKQSQTVSATMIHSAERADSPIRLEVVYSGL